MVHLDFLHEFFKVINKYDMKTVDKFFKFMNKNSHIKNNELLIEISESDLIEVVQLLKSNDNCKFKSLTDQGGSALLELSSDENYLMIIHNNIPVITDVFLRQPEKDLLKNFSTATANSSEYDAVIRRYSMQIKQALADYEAKYEQKISNIQIVSSLKNVKEVIPIFKKHLQSWN